MAVEDAGKIRWGPAHLRSRSPDWPKVSGDSLQGRQVPTQVPSTQPMATRWPLLAW